jgi:hypothetical protein
MVDIYSALSRLSAKQQRNTEIAPHDRFIRHRRVVEVVKTSQTMTWADAAGVHSGSKTLFLSRTCYKLPAMNSTGSAYQAARSVALARNVPFNIRYDLLRDYQFTDPDEQAELDRWRDAIAKRTEP